MMLTVEQAADRRGRDPKTIRRWIKDGLRATKTPGGMLFIDDRHLQSFKKRKYTKASGSNVASKETRSGNQAP